VGRPDRLGPAAGSGNDLELDAIDRPHVSPADVPAVFPRLSGRCGSGKGPTWHRSGSGARQDVAVTFDDFIALRPRLHGNCG